VAERKEEIADAHLSSRKIADQLLAMPLMEKADAIMSYVSFGSEVYSMSMITRLIAMGRRVSIPYCVEDELRLFVLKDFSELMTINFGVLEPKLKLRELPERQMSIDELQIVIVPGIAFDPNGGRVGRGKGYYDRFIKKLPENVTTIALAFDCQMFDNVPMNENDQFVKIIVTESKIYTRP
jgi:5-formyltetrahydrofolate cyclo-ligase